MDINTHRFKGIMMIISGAMLWGATGPLMEWILSTSEISVSFLITIRLVLAGALLLFLLAITKKKIFAIWKQPFWVVQLLIFGIVGMLGVQYTFVAAIDASNAVLATLLQFLAPIFVILYVSFSMKKLPPKYQVIGIIGTLFGLFLLLTNGSVDNLLVSKEALLWGLGVGVTFAFYTLYPTSIMNEWGVLIVVGWGMLIGGLVLGLIKGFWEFENYSIMAELNLALVFTVVVIIGTSAFVLFLSSMKYISPVETSILSSFEPLTAMVISVIWLDQVLEVWQLIGVVFMLVCVTWLSIEGDRANKKMNN